MSEVQEQLEQEKEGSIQQKEEKVLEKSGVTFEDNTYKLDLRNAVKEQSTDEAPVRDEPETSPKVEEEVRSPEEPAQQKEKEPVLELVKEESDELRMQTQDVQKEDVTQEEAPVVQEAKEEVVLPENIQKVVDFMQETGGSLEDYVRLNADYSNVDEQTLLREYYKQTKSHLDNDEISFLLEDKFSYDEELDETRDIKRKKLAYKEEVNQAKKFLNSLKDKYYDEVKLNSNLTPDQKQAVEFYNTYNKQQDELSAVQQKQSEQFTNLTNQVFNEEFKGFDFKVGDDKYRFKVNDVQQTKQVQSDIVNSFKTFLDENNMLKDAQGYHKALFAARNADTIANHFYEQGRADGLRQLEAESKNINMDPRKTSTGVIETSGVKVRAISGEDGSKLRFKIKK
jgi:hypothetical protein